MSLIIGTAGHIDHGKTTLIAALTGVDCDRLLEENHRRAAAEAPGRSAPGGSGSRRTRGRKSAKAVQIPVQEATLDI
mgnify:CR=1 FL=1